MTCNLDSFVHSSVRYQYSKTLSENLIDIYRTTTTVNEHIETCRKKAPVEALGKATTTLNKYKPIGEMKKLNNKEN